MTMPKIDFTKLEGVLTGEELELVRLCVAMKGANKGCLKVQHSTKYTPTGDGHRKADLKDSLAHYVWRMLTFNLCAYAPYVCMPMCASWDIPRSETDEDWMTTERQICKVLDMLVDKVLMSAFTPADWHGIQRWGRAFGRL